MFYSISSLLHEIALTVAANLLLLSPQVYMCHSWLIQRSSYSHPPIHQYSKALIVLHMRHAQILSDVESIAVVLGSLFSMHAIAMMTMWHSVSLLHPPCFCAFSTRIQGWMHLGDTTPSLHPSCFLEHFIYP